jgi:cytochrome c5
MRRFPSTGILFLLAVACTGLAGRGNGDEPAAAPRTTPGVGAPDQRPAGSETTAEELQAKEEALIDEGELIAAGKLEIDARFQAARPMWSYDGLETLNEAWAEEADDPAERARMEAMSEFSQAWWEEMDLRYGLHRKTADFGQEFTVGLGLVRTTANVVGTTAPGMSSNCRLCHSTVLFTNPDPHDPQPKFAEGIPNAFLDFERFHQNIATTGGTSRGFLFAKNLPRFFADSADFFGILVPVLRPDGIKPSVLRYEKFFMADHGSSYTKKLEAKVPLIPFLKPQPWTNYRYKTNGTDGQGLYVDGGFSGNVADVTYAMAISRDHLGGDYAEARATFKQCVPAYFNSLETPRYPFIADVTEARADRGQTIYANTCSRCHGEYRKTGPKAFELVDYPGRLVDQEELGTDPLRILGLWDLDVEEKKKFLSGSVEVTHRYVAPPLAGIWARGPYLHNASVPTVYDLLKSSSRPRKYSMRPSSTDPRNYDQEKLGWKYVDQSAKSHDEVLELMAHDPYLRVFDPDWRSAEDWEALREALASVKNVKVDATKPELYTGMLNTGHTFGDGLSEEERLDLLEFLKCL